MNKPIISNVTVYKAIAEEAYSDMVQLVNSGRKRKTDGSDGWIIQLDPEQKSFKKAMISIVFTGMWLEALTHLLIVKKFGEKKFKEYDFKSYEEKLELLGITEKET